MNVKVNYEFISEFDSSEEKLQKDIVSYAGRLLEITGCCTLIIGIDNEDKPFCFQCDARLLNSLNPANRDVSGFDL